MIRDTIGRVLSFVRRETASTLRQPRLLLILVLGPFLVLFVFGLGYSRDFPTLTTVVVGEEDSQLDQRIQEFASQAEVTGIDYVGTRQDRDAALADLRAGEVDLVISLPPIDEVGQDERALIEVHHRSPDPVTTAQIDVAAQEAVHRINDQVVAELITTIQEETEGLADDFAEVRDQLAAVRDAVDADDVATAQRAATELAERLDGLADQVARGSSLLAPFEQLATGTTIEQTMRDAAEQLRTLSATDPLGRLDEADAALATAEEALTQLQGSSADVLARPFEVDVVSETPAEVTLDRFYAPGLVALMLQHVAITFAALGIVRERRQGTSEVLRVAPGGTGERLAGTSLAHLTLGGIIAAALTALIVLVFGVPAPSSWLALVGLMALTLLASLGYGYLVAAASRTESQAVQLSMLMLLTAIFFSGLFLPLDRINVPVRWVSWALPTTHAFEGMQQLMLLGSPVPWFIWVGLGVMAVVSLGAASVLVPRRDVTG